MKFLLVSVTGEGHAEPVEVESLEELVEFIDHDGGQNDVLISKQSLINLAHDKKQRKAGCRYVLCLLDDFFEDRKIAVEEEREQ